MSYETFERETKISSRIISYRVTAQANFWFSSVSNRSTQRSNDIHIVTTFLLHLSETGGRKAKNMRPLLQRRTATASKNEKNAW